jgi:hypothetical protein
MTKEEQVAQNLQLAAAPLSSTTGAAGTGTPGDGIGISSKKYISDTNIQDLDNMTAAGGKATQKPPSSSSTPA